MSNNHQLAQHSRSGPQTPIKSSSLGRRGEFYREPLKDHDHYGTTRDHSDTASRQQHEQRCVFNRLLLDDQQPSVPAAFRASTNDGDEDDDDAQVMSNLGDDPHKQYVAVQQGHDIPLKGLRKPAPKANIYKGECTTDSVAHLIQFRTITI